MGFFWASVVTVLSTALYSWTNSDRINQSTMLLIYCLLACSITLAVASVVDIANYSILGKRQDAQTGILLGSLIAFGTVASIAVRCSKRFPASLSWGTLLALLMAWGFSSFCSHALAPEFAHIGTVALLFVVMAAFILLCRCKQNLSDNQYLSILALVAVIISFNSPSTKDSFTVGLTSSSLFFLAGLQFVVERRMSSATTRVAGLLLIYIGFMSVVQDTLFRGIGINEILAGIPTLLCSVIIISWIRFQKAEIPRGFYLVSLFIFGLFGIASIIPESHSDALTMPIFYSLILFIVACVLYASTASPSIGHTWREQFRYARVAGGFVILLSVTAAWFVLSTNMLIHNYDPARVIALLNNTSLWLGDATFVRLAMMEESLWAGDVGDVPADKLTLNRYLEAIRPSGDRFSKTIGTTDYQQMDQGVDNESIGTRWVADKNSFTLTKVEQNSPAGKVGLTRGDRVVTINGVWVKDMKEVNWDKLFAAWKTDAPISLNVVTKGGAKRTVSMKIGNSEDDPPMSKVISTANGKKVGYLYLESFNAAQFNKITNHFEVFQKEGVHDLVLDLRYNTGGYIRKASMLANLIAGQALGGKVFLKTEHALRQKDSDLEYHVTQLPESLDTRRLVVLTTNETCSASEAIINGLRPYMPVYTVGSTTCGKPYVMEQIKFGDKTLLPVTARVINSRGEGHYISGIRPDFKANDDLKHQLGDPQEGMLKKALEVLEKDP
jgi:carboxyl-terminal processing protease